MHKEALLMGKYVGIIAAMPEEMEAIKNKMLNQNDTISTRGNTETHLGFNEQI